LQNAAAEVASAYRRAGWVVRAYLPQQDVSTGTVTIQVVEARLGKVKVEGQSRVLASRVEMTLLGAQKAGQPIRAEDVDRGLLILEDTPGIAATGVLVPGSEPGATDVLVKLSPKPLVRGDLSADNTGSPATGRARLGASLTLASPFQMGDLFNATLSHTEGSDYGRVAYSLPVGHDGWRLGVNASDMRYRLTGDAFVALNARGNSTSYGMDASYPLLRSRARNLLLAMTYDHKRYDNEANGATTSRYNTDAFSVGLAGNAFDDYYGGGANSANLNLIGGRVDLSNSPTLAADAATARTDGSFSKLRYSLSRLQAVNSTFSLYALLTGQAASKNLDSSEKFYLGGPSGVRAYPAGEGGGSEGQLVNLEARMKLPREAQLAAFYDWGRVRTNVDNNYLGAPALNSYSLQGVGLTLSGQVKQLNLRLTYARRLGSNPNPSASGADQDGSLIRNRVWLQAAGSF
jgi:hemolysin activation/secretion protein